MLLDSHEMTSFTCGARSRKVIIESILSVILGKWLGNHLRNYIEYASRFHLESHFIAQNSQGDGFTSVLSTWSLKERIAPHTHMSKT